MGLWDWDLVTGELVWDERSARLYGTTLADSTGSIADVEARVHPDDLPAVQAALAGAIETGGAVDVEFRVVWPDGSLHWVYGKGQALVAPNGEAVRLIGTNVDVTEQRSAAQSRVEDAQRMAGLVAVAHELGPALTEREVLEVVARHGTSVLGAQGAGLCLLQPGRDVVEVLATGWFDEALRTEVAELPASADLPIVLSAVTGAPYFFRDRAATLAMFPRVGDLYDRARTEGSAEVPLRSGGRSVGTLSVAFAAPYAWRPADRELLEALAALTAQALVRVRAARAERAAMTAVRRLSETLQRSLLTAPPEPNHLQIATRYQPAALEAQVGGDWYDAFVTPDGCTTVVVGDVAGHDQDAAAAMAQVRNVLRGVAQMVVQPPAQVLASLDRALAGLQLTILATCVLCRVEQTPADRLAGRHVLRWTNAGHLPPLLLLPDGTAELLETDPDLLLGLEPDSARADHAAVLPAGATVVLYTDGLVERRGQGLDEGLDRLRATVEELAGLSTDGLCDALLARLADGSEDDVALLVLRLPPDDGSAAGLQRAHEGTSRS